MREDSKSLCGFHPEVFTQYFLKILLATPMVMQYQYCGQRTEREGASLYPD
jgi:hypothetical protein